MSTTETTNTRIETRLRSDLEDARREYRDLAEHVIEKLNPSDDDVSEYSILAKAIDRITEYVESQPCTCPPGTADYEADACPRCLVLGRRVDRQEER